jgi:hypothetical protein
MTVPTAINIKFKFPDFVGVDNGVIEFAIEEAVIACNSTRWVDDANQTLATMYYTAHLLQVSLMRAASGTGQLITSERAPDLSITYSGIEQIGKSDSDFNTTQYGIRYLDLVEKNFPAVMVANSPVFT